MVRVTKTLNPGLKGNDAEKLNRDLHKRIVGQDEAIQQIVSIYQTFIAGMNSPGRPIGNLLFLGPTGTGKTRLVESVAESMLGDSRAVIKIDCAEFQHSHEIAKLIGSPPGYLGHRETHPLLSQEVLNQYHTDRFKVSFVLFDEIEKASDALWNLLLGILDKATLTLGDNRRVDFSRTMIFMTSNLGASEMGAILRPNLGFSGFENEHRATTGRTDVAMSTKISRTAVEAARRKFSPEFINRIDKVIVFKPLGSNELDQILTLELNQLQQRIFNAPNSTPFIFNVSPSAKKFLLQEGTDLKYGARHLKRAIERNVVHAFSNLMASSQIRAGDLVMVDTDPELGTLSFVKEAEDMPTYAMVQMIDMSVPLSAAAMAMNQETETPRVVNARSSRR
ncbi:MAG TPA: ATP-dependent Clp protease ATP-binding subunit [Solibacterales bacterium]|nr:ATP-dependent Clp protease ATP-binding subunit [Bryobacterales bacterium]